MSPHLLCVFAHPDDETFAAAGLIARLTDRGGRVSLVCATMGQKGSTGAPPLCSREQLPERREQELRAAAGILGVHTIELLGYMDGELETAPVEDMRQRLVGLIRSLRPEVVLTFDPNGLNGHRDHIAIGRFTLDAVSAAADSRFAPELGAAHRVQRVLWPSPFMPAALASLDSLGSRFGDDMVVVLSAGERTRKEQALAAHATQHASVDTVFHEPGTTLALAFEAFRLGAGREFRVRPASDPFED